MNRIPAVVLAASLLAFAAEASDSTRIVLRERGQRSIQVLKVDARETDATLRKLRARGDIEFAVVDRRKYRHAVPNDSLFADQWYLQNTQPAAIGANLAWDVTIGSAGTVVAVLDSGVRFDHPDLARARDAGKLLPGYDFIAGDGGSATQFLTANDGDGRDPDPSDPGDWVDSNDKNRPFFSSCDTENSSWHGTRTAGLIAAASNNAQGMAGVAWQTWILPVRVLGKCGGYDADILDAMRWAAGLSVPGVPNNPYPAHIINLSLGSEGVCSAPYRSVIDELSQLGVTVVVSAGNSGGPVEEPANCPGVIAVAGLRHAGTKVGYSSLGPEVTLAAPAGNCVNTSGACLFSLLTTVDTGRTTPSGAGYTDQFNANLGTSFSAPLVAGVGALMHSVNARLKPQHVSQRLQQSARPFPTGGVSPPPTCHVPTGPTDLQQSECVCTTQTCGAGMLYAPTAVAAAQRPIAHIAVQGSITPGATLTLDGSGSAASCNRSLAGFIWSIVSSSGASPSLSNMQQSTVQVAVPSSGSFTLRLTVTDDQGAADSGEITITPSSATSNTVVPLTTAACPATIAIAPEPTPAPAPAPVTPSAAPSPPPNSGGGGGAFGLELFVLSLALANRKRRLASR